MAKETLQKNSELPPWFRGYSDGIAAEGLVEMELARESRSNPRTVIRLLRTRAPLLVQRALYPDQTLPSFANIFIMSSSGGILQGDRLSIELAAGEETASRITTQASTKVYKMHAGYATQKIKIHARSGSYVEFLPHSTILYKHSRFYQQVLLKVEAGATVLYSDTLSAGRIASGERFDFDIYFMKLTARDENDNLLFADNLKVEPDRGLKQLIVDSFAGKTILSTVYIFCAQRDAEAIEQLIKPNFVGDQVQNRMARRYGSILAGYSRLPESRGLIAKMLSDSIDGIRAVTETISDSIKHYICDSASLSTYNTSNMNSNVGN